MTMKFLLCLAQLYLRICIGSGLIAALFPTPVIGNHFPAPAFIWLLRGIIQSLLGIMLIIGYKTRLVAYLAAVLFSLTGMYLVSNPQAYSPLSGLLTIAAAGGALLLGLMQGGYRWSLDNRNHHGSR